MSFVRNVKINFYKILTGYGFYLCMLFTIALCFSAYIYTAENGDRYSVFTVLKSFDRETMLSNENFSSFEVMHQSTQGWLPMFIPIISSFAFIPLVCDEYEAKSVRMEIFRSSKLSYNLAKFFSACVCGGLAVMLGFMIFTAVEWQLFPSISDYSPNIRGAYIEMLRYSDPFADRMALSVICKFGELFLYGALCAVPSIMLTSFVRNKYLVMCIPFFIKYAVGQVALRFMMISAEDYSKYSEKFIKLIYVIHPDNLLSVSRLTDKKEVFIYSGFLALTALIFYLAVQNRRYDSGD